MSELSELYDRDNGFATYNTTYQWSNPNTPAPYYQSFNISGKGTIDQSIFSIVRMNDSYSLGAYMSFLENGTSTLSHVPTWHSVKNNFSKNNDNITHIAYNDVNAYYSYDFTRQFSIMSSNPTFTLAKAKYSPGVIQYSNQLEQRFLRDFDYNSLVLYPWFGYRYGDYNTLHTGNYNDLMQAYQQYPNTKVVLIRLQILYSESRDLTYARTERRSLGIYMQFAGTIPTFSYQSNLNNQWYSYINQTGTDSGVYLLTALCNNSNLFLGPYYYPNAAGAKPANSLAYIVNENFTDIIPFDYSILETIDWTASGNGVRQYCMSVESATTVLDRLGYNWAATLESAQTSKTGAHCTDPNIRCPVIDPEGNFVTETTLSGTDIAEYAFSNPDSNYNWGSGDIEYDGKSIIEVRITTEPEQATIEPADEIDLNEPTAATLGGTALWILSKTDIDIFFNWMWDPEGSSFDDIVKGVALLGNNPMDSMISLKVFPLKLEQYLDYDQKTVCFGRTACTALQNKFHVISSNVLNLDLGSFSFNEAFTFKDFRDYEPYSDYSLYLPFCGIIHLSAVECVNTTVSIKYIIDIITGSCTAVVFTNGVPYQYINGMIGIEMPLTGRNLSDYANTVMGAALGGTSVGGLIGNKAAKAASANGYGDSADNWAHASQALKSGNVTLADNFANDALMGPALASPAVMGLAFGVAGAAIGGTISALTNAPAIESKGSNTPATGLSKPFYPYLIVRHSETWFPENYNMLYGRPLVQGGVVGDFHGFSTFGNIKVDDIEYATSEEKVLISELLTKGVYL
jgi:hypothetical protein